ncbi:MAG: DDE-type integrase/transposase/recombinase [Myxococcota bacterium]|nr:DDE-type integrase/transposase/recombinase [Myxococcota bacterium]
MDFVQRYIGSSSTFTLILIDDCSRYVVGHGVDDAERADMVLNTFEEATNKHGRPERVMHDKGSAFWSWRGISRFSTLLTEMGIDIVVAEHKEWEVRAPSQLEGRTTPSGALWLPVAVCVSARNRATGGRVSRRASRGQD